MNSNWVYFNPHPQQKIVGDCVKRALTKATGMDYRDVKIELNRIKRQINGSGFNDKKVYEYFLRKHGFVKYPINVTKGSSRGTINQLCRSMDDDEIIVCSVAGHLVTLEDHKFHDTWDCGYKSLYCTYRKLK